MIVDCSQSGLWGNAQNTLLGARIPLCVVTSSCFPGQSEQYVTNLTSCVLAPNHILACLQLNKISTVKFSQILFFCLQNQHYLQVTGKLKSPNFLMRENSPSVSYNPISEGLMALLKHSIFLERGSLTLLGPGFGHFLGRM